ncbi:hypothetical protein [Puniceibacterium confluentis]|uniref:hypothetical protein n=1 Tax=Puniceibacterium confluentis TaxID=1958944 RepID=UPI0011B8487D|nr:hypothetical protein [Puniceibacterium confluentis]
MIDRPATAFRDIHLGRAHSLLAETDMSGMEDAVTGCFCDVALVSRYFQAQFDEETQSGKRRRT